jgi:DNA-directed RNA polymerase subunit RPC12/RpoP
MGTKKTLNLILIFIATFIVIYLVFLLKDKISSISIALIIAAIITIFSLFFLKSSNTIISPKKGFLRYTMLCHNCGWEWMSHKTEKEMPHVCPNCGEKSKLEPIGWRRVQATKKSGDNDLRKFFGGK